MLLSAWFSTADFDTPSFSAVPGPGFFSQNPGMTADSGQHKLSCCPRVNSYTRKLYISPRSAAAGGDRDSSEYKKSTRRRLLLAPACGWFPFSLILSSALNQVNSFSAPFRCLTPFALNACYYSFSSRYQPQIMPFWCLSPFQSVPVTFQPSGA